MSVSKINFNTASAGSKVNFKGTEQVLRGIEKYKVEQKLEKEIYNSMPKVIQGLKKLSSSIGEVQTILINAIGTGLVAPFFIKHNFLAKTDEDTRTYSAMRQPISAGLAVLTQAGVVNKFNHFLNDLTNSGKLSQKYDLSACQDISYIKKQLKKSNPNLSKEEISKLADKKHL